MSRWTYGWWALVVAWEALILVGVAGTVITPGLYALFVCATFTYGLVHLVQVIGD